LFVTTCEPSNPSEGLDGAAPVAGVSKLIHALIERAHGQEIGLAQRG
jgi:hypothetical protein